MIVGCACYLAVLATTGSHALRDSQRLQLLQFPVRAVLQPSITANEATSFTTTLRRNIAPYAATVELLLPDEVGRRLALQETWVLEGLGSTPTPDPLPTIVELRSIELMADAPATQRVIDTLKKQREVDFVAFDQIAADMALSVMAQHQQQAAVISAALNTLALLLVAAGWAATRAHSCSIVPDALLSCGFVTMGAFLAIVTVRAVAPSSTIPYANACIACAALLVLLCSLELVFRRPTMDASVPSDA